LTVAHRTPDMRASSAWTCFALGAELANLLAKLSPQA
jgi:hypothetical protein